MSAAEQPRTEATSTQDELLERAYELAELELALDRARHGSGRVVIVEGDPGIGKSSLLDAVRERARQLDTRVLSASGLELERDFPFGVALRLLEPVLDGLEPVQRRVLFTGPAATAAALFEGRAVAASAARPDQRDAIVRALRHLTVNLASNSSQERARGLAIVLDDAQWSDDDSLRFLTHLGARVGMLPIAIVVAARLDSLETATLLRRGLAISPRARVLRLSPLSEPATERVVRATYPEAEPAFVRACARMTGGNPFYLRELLESARADRIVASAEGAAAVESLVPESVVNSVLLRLARLPDPAMALASAVAVLGDGASLRHAAWLARLDGEAAEQAADLLAAAHILRADEPLAFVHPLIGGAVHADLPALARSRSHRRAAEILDAEGAPVENVGAHLLACRPDGDAWVVKVLRVAAERAAARGEDRLVRRLLDRAVAESPTAELPPGLLVDRALAHAATGVPEAVAPVREALEVAEPRERVDVLRSHARLLLGRSEFAAAADAAHLALSELGSDDPRAPGLLVEAVAVARLGDSAPSSVVTARLTSVLKEAEAGRLPSDPGLRALLAGAMLGSRRPAQEIQNLALSALAELPDDDGFYGIITGFVVVSLISVGELTAAADKIDATLDRARAAEAHITIGMASHWLALLRYHLGDLAGTIAAGRQALEVAHAGWEGWVSPIVAHAYMDQGDLEAATDVLRSTELDDAGRPEYSLARAARGRLAQLNNEPAVAMNELLAAGAQAERRGVAHLMVIPWRSAAALAAALVGEREQADDLAQTELVQARTVGVPRNLGIALRVAGLARGGTKGLAWLREAVEVLDRSPAALERARALVELGSALRRDGQLSISRGPLHRGLELAETLGAQPLAEQARHELRAAGGRLRPIGARSDPSALTPTEQRIAELAAGGLSTLQIARSLYVTAKTVDWHLGNAYRKLGIHSRRQLAEALARNVDAPSGVDRRMV
jgi:DNA-binding CsgD family transcriptional regulator